MKRVLASFLAIIIALSVMFSVPTIFSRAIAEELVITNTYDEAGLTKEMLRGNNIFHFGTKTAATPNTTKVVQFYPIAGQTNIANGNFTYVEIYDPNSNFSSFITEPDTDYKINFDFKVKAGTYGDINFNIREVVNGTVGDILGTAATVAKGDTNFSDYAWGKAEVVLSVTKPNTVLAISIETTVNDVAKLYPYLDNIVVEKVTDGDTTLTIHHDADGSVEEITLSNNTFISEITTTKRVDGKRLEGLYTDNTYTKLADGIVFGKTELWAKWVSVPTKVENTYDEAGLTKDMLSSNNIFHFGTKTAATPNTTKVVQFYPISGKTNISNGNYTYVEIYDPNSNFGSFITEPDADYKINFDFKVKAGTYGDINFNIREVVNGTVGDILGTAATVVKGDTDFSDYTWGKAEVVLSVTKPNTVLAISIETTVNDVAKLYPYLDNIVVEKVTDGDTTLTIHHDVDNSQEELTAPNKAFVNEIATTKRVDGKRLEGLYTDNTYTKLASGIVFGKTELWAKWVSVPTKVENTYDEAGLTKDMLCSNNIFHFGTKTAATPNTTKVVQFYPISGQENIANNNFTYVEIYDPNSNFASFITEPDADYKINFDFKVKAGTYGNINFNIREVVNGKVGNIIGTAATVVKGDTNFNDYAWGKAETVVAVTKPNTVLAISIETTVSDVAKLYPYLDNIVVEKTTDRQTVDITVNNYKNDGTSKTVTISKNALFTQIELDARNNADFLGLYTDKDLQNAATGKIGDCTAVWVKWRREDVIENTYDEIGYVNKDTNFDTASTNPIVKVIAEGRTGNALQFMRVYGSERCSTLPYTNIYNSNESDYSFLKPDVGDTYHLTLWYNPKSNTRDTALELYGVKNADLSDGVKLADICEIPKETTIEWRKVSVVFTVTEEFNSLAIAHNSFRTDGRADQYFTLIDDVKLEKIPAGDTTLTIHHSVDASTEEITVPNSTSVSDIAVSKHVVGQKIEGYYTDNTYTTLVDGIVFGKTELWAKWVTVPSKVENTYDEAGLTEGMLNGNNIFHFGTKSAAEPNTTKVVQFYPISGQTQISKGDFTYIGIYDPNSDFNGFITESDADYKITFDFKVKSGTYGNIDFNIREVINGKVGNIIGTAATVVKGDEAYSDYTWGKAETIVAITKPDTTLAISIESAISDIAKLYPYLDNIVVEKTSDRQTVDITVNNYKNDGSSKTVTISKNALFTQIELDAVNGMDFMGFYTDENFQNAAKGKIGDCTAVWAKWREGSIFDNSYEEPGITKDKLKGKDITFLGVRESTGHDGKVLQFNKIAGQNSISENVNNITRVEIYNPTSTDFESFVPEVNATYLITFDYKQKSTKSDIRFNIREVIDGNVGDILGNAAVIKGNDPKFTTAIWAKGEAIITVTKPDTALAITIEYTGDSDGSLWPYLDNVVIDKIPSPKENKEIIIHNYDGSNDKTLKLPNATLFTSIEIPDIYGKKYEGLYFDKECTKSVEGAIYRYNEVWAKWRTSADADKIVNNYDDNGVYYKEELNLDRFDEKFKPTEAEEKKANNYITRYSDSGFKNAIDSDLTYQNFAIGSIAEGRSGNAIQLNSASVASTTKPPLVRIYDNRDSEKKIYKPRPNTIYKIEFYVKSTQLVSKDMHIAIKGYSDQANSFGAGTFLKYCLTIKNGTVIKDWVKVETYFTVPDAEYDFLGISLMASGSAVINGKNAETDTYNVQVSIDDISVTEVFDTYYLIGEANNGDKAFKVPFMAGELLDTVPSVKKSGFVFAGWFTDPQLKTPFTYGKMPEENVEIYGKWEELTDSAYNFSTGFEKGDFSISYPYTNTEKNKMYSNNMTPAVTVVTNPDDVHDEGEKYLHFEIDPASSRQTMDMAAVALLNPDGSSFQVVKGKRYSIDFSLRCDTDCYIVPVVSDQTPTGRLNLSNSTEINRTWFRPYWYHNKEEWGTMKNVFIPNTSGKVYLLVYYGSTYVDIDNVEIKCATNKEVVQVKFYNEKGNSVGKPITGRVGDWMFPPVPAAKEGYVFDGWYDGLDENAKVYAKSVLPGDDMKLYSRYRIATPVGDNPATVKEDGIKIDYEGDNARKLAFYQSNNDCWIGNNDALFVVDDPDGAHSGSNYFKFNNAGQWTASEYRRFRFYNEDTSDNRVYLEPLSVYKVGFWMKVDRTWSAAMRIVAFDTTDKMGVISNQQVVALTEVETEEDYGKWIYYEGELTTGSDICTAGIMISGGFLTASIDDITVRKMKKLVVSFDSLGGTPVASLETFENQYVVAPIEPEKEGYYFGGWYTEKDLVNLFDFNNTPITQDITLYAKWIEIRYKDVTTYEIEEIKNPLPIENPELDNQLKLTVAKNGDVVKKSSSPLPLIISGVAAMVVIVCGILAFILIKRHKKKR